AASDDLTLPGAGLVAEYQFTRGDVEEQYKVTHIIPGEAASEDDPAVETETAEEGAPTAEAEAAEEGAEEPAGEVADAGDDELTSLEADDAFGALEAEMQPDEEEGLQEESAFDDITGEEPAGGDIDDIFGEEIPEVDVGIEETVEASPVQFDEFAQQSPSNGKGRKIDMLLDVELDVTVELGRKVMLVEDILRLGKGSVVELNKLAGEPVDILVNGRKLAEGEVVVVEDHFGVRLTHLIDPKDRIRSLGKG
ncbi:MAG: flagellar motor switch protein FliN, partial [Candidatus Marinimicrobia bacterium]|nr:flagellar motor switch protein FliN [Candidatus Neomarinimicrobiota bacterium]